MDAREKWGKLPKRAQAELLNKHRYDNTGCIEWWDSIEDDFKKRLGEFGVFVEEIHFSGFSWQGDGACFTGGVRNWRQFTNACGIKISDELLETHVNSDITLRWNQRGHYCHEHSLLYEDELYVNNPYDEVDYPLRHIAWANSQPEGGALQGQFGTMVETIRGWCKELYRDLEKEYDYLTTDEQVLEEIIEYHEDEIDHLLEEYGDEVAA